MTRGPLSFSKDPPYTPHLLQKAEKYLKYNGYLPEGDDPAYGIRKYRKAGPDGGHVAYIFLEELKCDPQLTGHMVVAHDKGADHTTVFRYVTDESRRDPFFKRLIPRL